MANPFAKFVEPNENPFAQYAPAGDNPFAKFAEQPQEPTEQAGFFGSFGSALRERAKTALPAAELFTGLGNQKQATDDLLKANQ